MGTVGSTTRRDALKYAALVALPTFVAPPRGWNKVISVRDTGSGYGPDPDRLKRPVTWPRTLVAGQLKALAVLCEIILPAEGPHPSAAAIGVNKFLDEWVSAPYPQMRSDRVIIVRGLRILDEMTHRDRGVAYAESELSIQVTMFDRVCGGADTVRFASRLIELVCSGYYTTRDGHAAIGYVGNSPMSSFPAPSPEIIRRVETALDNVL
jgi:gluconate 2-dehydrogenase gamma chain